MKINLTLCAEKFIVDGASGEIVIINLMERIIVGSFPVFIPYIAFATFMERQDSDPTETQITVVLTHGEKEIARQSGPISFGDVPWFRHFTAMSGIPIYGPGKLTFTITAGDATNSYQLPIMLPPQGARLFDRSLEKISETPAQVHAPG